MAMNRARKGIRLPVTASGAPPLPHAGRFSRVCGTGPIICLALPFLLAGDLTEMSKEAMTQDRSERG